MNNFKSQVNCMLNTINTLNTNEKIEAIYYLKEFITDIQKETNQLTTECCKNNNFEIKEADSRNAMYATRCFKCNKSFETNSQLYDHFTQCVESSLTCRFCKTIFNDTDNFNSHITEHVCKADVKTANKGHIIDGIKKYICIKCDHSFANKKSFQLHILENHCIKLKRNAYMCKLCNKTFKQKKLFYRHYKKSHCDSINGFDTEVTINYESTAEKCKITDRHKHKNKLESGETYKIADEKQNINIEHKFQCAHCEKSFSKRNLLANHLKICLKDKEYGCTLCKKKFLKYRYYKEHMTSLTHRNNSNSDHPFAICKICKKSFPNKQGLSVHMFRVHNNKSKQLACTICDFKTTLPVSLNRHITLHTGNRQFVCEECGSCFRTESALKDHKMYLHSTERNYSCEKCGRTFKMKNGLKRHFKSHSDERSEKCFCGQVYKLATNLRKHQRQAHGNGNNKRKVVHKLVDEGDGYLMNSPKMVKLQSSTKRLKNAEQKNIEELNIQPMEDSKNTAQKNIQELDIEPINVLCDVDLSCTDGVLQNDDYNFSHFLEESNPISSMITSLQLVNSVLPDDSIPLNTNPNSLTDTITKYDQNFSSISYLRNIDLENENRLIHSSIGEQTNDSLNVTMHQVPTYLDVLDI